MIFRVELDETNIYSGRNYLVALNHYRRYKAKVRDGKVTLYAYGDREREYTAGKGEWRAEHRPKMGATACCEKHHPKYLKKPNVLLW